jgi:hypothetical protein
MIRADTWTATPAMSSPRSSISPTWTPARAWRSSAGSASRIQRAAWVARAGPEEHGEDAVARRLDQAAIEALQAVVDDPGVAVEPGCPRRISKSAELVAGPHEVREEDRREHPLRVRHGLGSSDEVAQLREYLRRVPEPRKVLAAGQLDHPGAGDALRSDTGGLDRQHPVIRAAEDERGLTDRR